MILSTINCHSRAGGNPFLDVNSIKNILGGISGGVTPVPIPNTAVKPACGDGTILERVWESSTLPGLNKAPSFERGWGFFVIYS